MTADEVLFERFRRRGDADALARLFDRAAPALLRIALHLAGEPASAEDLVQGTFLAAIEAREQWDGRRPVMPWLCGILQNRSRALRRQLARTPDPTRLPTPANADPARAAEIAEFDAAVDAAIAQLPQTYQPVLRLHLAYAHAPGEIAHALDRPPATVRSQLARGLDLLRKALPASLLAGAAVAMRPGRGLEAVRRAVLAQESLASITVPAAAFAGSLLGGVLLMKKAIALLVIAALAALVWTQWPRQESPALPLAANGAPAPASGNAAAAANPTANNDRVPVGPPAPGATATTGTLHVKVLWPDGTPGADLHLNVEPTFKSWNVWTQREVVTGKDGTATVTDLAPGDGQLRVDWRCGAQFAITAGQTTECEVKVPPGVDVHGVVVDEGGQPVPTARIWLSSFHGGDEGQDCGPVNADGTFVVRAVQPPPQNFFLAATAPGKRTSTLTRVEGKVGETQEVRIELRFPGVALIGRVFLPDGRPAKGARVLVGVRAVTNAWDQERFTREYRPPVDTRCDDLGTFRAEGLSPGSSVQVWLRHEATASRLQSVQLLTDRELVVQFDLFAGATIQGQVTDAAASPLGGIHVGARSDALFDLQRKDGFFFGPSWTGSGATTAADGSYEIAHVAAGRVRLDVKQADPRRSAATTVPVKDREVVTWDAVLTAGATIQGYVVNAMDVALAGWKVDAFGEDRRSGNSAKTDERGHFELADCSDGPWRVSVCAADAFARVPAVVKVGVRPGTTDLRIVVPMRAIPDATMIGKLLLADGSVPPKAGISWWRDGSLMIDTVPVEEDGSFRLGLLPAATYRVRAVFEKTRGAWTEAFALRERETLDLGTLQAKASGSAVATVRDADGKLLDGVECQIVESIEGLDAAFPGSRTQNGVARIADLAPGDYRLRIAGRDQPIVNTAFTIAEGKETAVDVTVQKSVACMLHLQPPSEGAPLQIAFTWSRDGEVFLQHSDWWRANAELLLPRRLLPGDYAIAITSETGKRELNRFTVAATDADGKEITVKLP